ncbi:MAG: ATP-binding cassette domain-containing protein [Bacteroidaceae bacterium]|nr:ATP-binding cassette domain-containing protein [Bacteroidaceae bacterium]
MIEISSIYKKFESQVVLNDISAVFENGKTNLIIGMSGAGKTVLLKCIVGLLTPDNGKVIYDGRNIITLGKKERHLMRREIGMLFQNAALFDSMSVLENVMFPLDMFSDMTYKERLERARFCLDRVNLIDAQEKYPDELSGGMQKRAAIARAIALEPKYLFCDEPNSGLDPQTSLIIDELIHDITKEYNITTVVNTHDMNSVMGIGDHILFLANGKLAWEGNKDNILNSNNETLNDFLFSSDLVRKVKEMGGK